MSSVWQVFFNLTYMQRHKKPSWLKGRARALMEWSHTWIHVGLKKPILRASFVRWRRVFCYGSEAIFEHWRSTGPIEELALTTGRFCYLSGGIYLVSLIVNYLKKTITQEILIVIICPKIVRHKFFSIMLT